MSARSCGCDPDFKFKDGRVGWFCSAHTADDIPYTGAEASIEDTGTYYAAVEVKPGPGVPMISGRPVVVWHPLPARTLNAETRKQHPIATGVLDYFPDALMAVANVSFVGNEQHNPGQPLHWDRAKSTDEADALLRHLKDRGKLDTDGTRHTAKVAWRSLALLQKEIEAERDGK